MKNQLQRKNETSILLALVKYGSLAQLVEQRTENPCVPGSIPGGATCKHNKNKGLGD